MNDDIYIINPLIEIMNETVDNNHNTIIDKFKQRNIINISDNKLNDYINIIRLTRNHNKNETINVYDIEYCMNEVLSDKFKDNFIKGRIRKLYHDVFHDGTLRFEVINKVTEIIDHEIESFKNKINNDYVKTIIINSIIDNYKSLFKTTFTKIIIDVFAELVDNNFTYEPLMTDYIYNTMTSINYRSLNESIKETLKYEILKIFD